MTARGQTNEGASGETAPITESSSNRQPSSQSNSNGNSRSRRNNNRSSNSSSTTVQSTYGTSFEGPCPEIGAVLGLRSEKITKKVPFSVFVEKLGNSTS